MKVETGKSFRFAGRVALFGGLALVVLGLAYRFLVPPVYEAAVRVRIENKGRTLAGPLRPAQVSEAPLMLKESLALQSTPLLGQVITNLNLAKAWGARGGGSSPLSADEALGMLKRALRVRVIPRTSVLEVRVSSGDRNEPDRIANEIIRLYHADHDSKRQSFTQDALLDLQRQWEQGNQQLGEARDGLAKVVADLRRARATNAAAYLSPADVAELRARRIDLETSLATQERSLAQLRALPPDQLREVLPTAVTNALLSGLESRLSNARLHLVEVRGSQGSNSPEVTAATAALRELDGHVTEVVQGLMTNIAENVALKRDALARLDRELGQSAVAGPDLSTNNPAYVAAFKEVRSLEGERQLLESKLNTNSLGVLYPLYPSTEILDAAEPPMSPSSPDARLTWGIFALGGMLIAGGLARFVLAARKPPGKTAPQMVSARR